MRKKLTKLLAFLMVCFLLPFQTFVFAQEKEMRAVWISTVYNLDYPSVKNNIESQKEEFINKLENLQSIGINTVIVQVRPKADALYDSAINPWSDVLTGTQGQNPGYDPMAFMIEETHKRGMEFHAWLNPYRITTTGTDVNVLSQNHPARLHPDWIMTHNNALYYNPELAGVKQHIQDTVKEIVTNYNVDGVHFDDYFYPEKYPLPQGEGKDGAVANARRTNVDEMVSMVHQTIKEIKPDVVFGISPQGIWKNKSSDATGSNTNGNECYYSVFADVRNWIKNGYIDYVVPQIYWETGHKSADYETLVNWWANEVDGTNVKLYIGQGIYKDTVAEQIDTQLAINEKYPQVDGSFYFSLKDLLNNRKDCKTKITQVYANKNVQAPTENENTNTANTKILVDGKEKPLQAYNIDGNNYFKLRDVAQAVDGTQKQFDVTWNESTQSIHMVTNKSYTPISETANNNLYDNKEPILSTVKLLLDTVSVSAKTYNISGNNYFKLRDLAQALDFRVSWNEQENSVNIITSGGSYPL